MPVPSALAGLEVDGDAYFYIRNLQNDIIGIMDSSGTVVVKYSYDSWGKVLSVTGPGAGGIGSINPFRYRGYYYDAETGMYYLGRRYYDPTMKRFICSDRSEMIDALDGLKDINLYSYCDNNPVIRIDNGGVFGRFLCFHLCLLLSLLKKQFLLHLK